MVEIYKYLNGVSPDIMSDIFKLRKKYLQFESQNLRTERFGLDSIAYRASQLWKNVLEKKSEIHPHFLSLRR